MLDARPLNEKVYHIILDRILTGELVAGQRLDAEELAQVLGVSRTPVKDALGRLFAEGLVEIRPRRGTCVTTLTPTEIRELFDVRKMVELYAAEAAVKYATPQQRAHLRDMVEELRAFIVGDGYTDYQSFLAKDHELHAYIVRLAGNSRLCDFYEGIKYHIQVARLARSNAGRRPYPSSDSYAEHLAIVATFEAGSIEDLRDAIAHHIDHNVAYLTQTLEDRRD